MSEQNFKFKGVLNGVEYDDPKKFVEALKKSTAEGNVQSISYQYYSSTEPEKTEQKKQVTDQKDLSEKKACKCGNGTVCNDTIERVTKIKEIIQQVAEFSEEISDSDTFTDDRLTTIREILHSSIEKIKYLICGMCANDREDFCNKLHDGMKRLYEEADSESRDLIYEEAKYRQELTESNADIEEEIEKLKGEYEENCEEIGWSYNRCSASQDMCNFFSDLVELLEIN